MVEITRSTTGDEEGAESGLFAPRGGRSATVEWEA